MGEKKVKLPYKEVGIQKKKMKTDTKTQKKMGGKTLEERLRESKELLEREGKVRPTVGEYDTIGRDTGNLIEYLRNKREYEPLHKKLDKKLDQIVDNLIISIAGAINSYVEYVTNVIEAEYENLKRSYESIKDRLKEYANKYGEKELLKNILEEIEKNEFMEKALKLGIDLNNTLGKVIKDIDDIITQKEKEKEEKIEHIKMMCTKYIASIVDLMQELNRKIKNIYNTTVSANKKEFGDNINTYISKFQGILKEAVNGLKEIAELFEKEQKELGEYREKLEKLIEGLEKQGNMEVGIYKDKLKELYDILGRLERIRKDITKKIKKFGKYLPKE